MSMRKRIAAALAAVFLVFGVASVEAGPASASDSGWNGT